MPSPLFLLGLLVVAAGACFLAGVPLRARGRARGRLFAGAWPEPVAAAAPRSRSLADEGRLRSWLVRAGDRRPDAGRRFLSRSAVALVAGLLIAWTVVASGSFSAAQRWLVEVPGNFGDLLLPILALGPWILFLLVALVPLLQVRARRRRLVADVEQDLPIVMELLATLAEAGLGLDAAIDRVLAAAPAERPLSRELRTWQRELRGGVPRVAAHRRLADRLDVASVSTFTSALCQAEQVGSGLADVLRNQAEDLRARRRELLLLLAQALPVKLVFPLVICFLPGLFVLTLGPAFHSFFRLAESVAGGRP